MNMKLHVNKKGNTFSVKMDSTKFERLAASFGFFSKEFLKSVNKAEKEYKNGKCKKINSLSELL